MKLSVKATQKNWYSFWKRPDSKFLVPHIAQPTRSMFLNHQITYFKIQIAERESEMRMKNSLGVNREFLQNSKI